MKDKVVNKKEKQTEWVVNQKERKGCELERKEERKKISELERK